MRTDVIANDAEAYHIPHLYLLHTSTLKQISLEGMFKTYRD